MLFDLECPGRFALALIPGKSSERRPQSLNVCMLDGDWFLLPQRENERPCFAVWGRDGVCSAEAQAKLS